jgi:hypothetical protein
MKGDCITATIRYLTPRTLKADRRSLWSWNIWLLHTLHGVTGKGNLFYSIHPLIDRTVLPIAILIRFHVIVTVIYADRVHPLFVAYKNRRSDPRKAGCIGFDLYPTKHWTLRPTAYGHLAKAVTHAGAHVVARDATHQALAAFRCFCRICNLSREPTAALCMAPSSACNRSRFAR